MAAMSGEIFEGGQEGRRGGIRLEEVQKANCVALLIRGECVPSPPFPVLTLFFLGLWRNG